MLQFAWMAGNECQHSFISEGEEAISGSHYYSQLRDGQDQQKVCHCYHSTSLYYSLSCCSPQPCFAHSIWLVFTAISLGISWLLCPLLKVPFICICHISVPSKGLSLSQLVTLQSGTFLSSLQSTCRPLGSFRPNWRMATLNSGTGSLVHSVLTKEQCLTQSDHSAKYLLNE